MSFGDLFGKTWKEYRANFWTNVCLLSLFYVLPLLITYLIVLGLFFGFGYQNDVSSLVSQAVTLSAQKQAGMIAEYNPEASIQFWNDFGSFLLRVWSLILGAIVLFIATALLTFYAYVSIITVSLRTSNYTVARAMRTARGNYWKMVGLVVSIFLIALLFMVCVFALIVLLVLLGKTYGVFAGIGMFVAMLVAFCIMIWASVCWVFSMYILVSEKRGIFASLGASARLVKGRWWRTFGFVALMYLIAMVVGMAFSTVDVVARFAVFATLGYSALDSASLAPALVSMLMTTLIISSVVRVVETIIIVPFLLLFFKNMYLAWKK